MRNLARCKDHIGRSRAPPAWRSARGTRLRAEQSRAAGEAAPRDRPQSGRLRKSRLPTEPGLVQAIFIDSGLTAVGAVMARRTEPMAHTSDALIRLTASEAVARLKRR